MVVSDMALKQGENTLTKALIAGAGGIGTLVTGFVFWRAWRRRGWRGESGPAYDPWRNWLQGGGTRRLVQAAILASSAHNSQPWRFQIGVDRIGVFADPARHLGSLDPFRRELHLSLGCALENLVQAARAHALSTSITLPAGRLSLTSADSPVSPADAVALVQFTPALDPEMTLYEAIPARHTHRGAYRLDRDIPEDLLNGMQALVPPHGSVRLLLFTRGAKQALGDLIVASTEAIVRDEWMAADNARWYRVGRGDVNEHRDGLIPDEPLVARRHRVPTNTRSALVARINRQWVRDTADIHVGTAPLLGIIAVKDPDDRPSTLHAGRLWQRLHLWLTTKGLAAQPLNQPVLRIDREREIEMGQETADALARVIGDAEWHPTLIFRAGYADQPARSSPRRAVDTTLIK